MLDARLRQNVLDKLAFEPSIDASNLDVHARKGIVTPSGTVCSCREKRVAEEAVARLRGIRGIRQSIRVVPRQSDKVADEIILDRATKALRWSGLLDGDDIEVSVRDGCVTLTGAVAWHHRKEAAVECVCNLVGVIDVVDRIATVRRPCQSDVKHRIEAALRRDANVEAHGIRVAVQDGKVVLAGRVYDWPERHAAERVAWASPGIHTVEDRILLD